MDVLLCQAGDAALEVIELAHGASQPVLLVGRHGVGKSSLFEQAAGRQGIGFIVRDLSLMEPVDLVGIPSVNPKGRTVYAPPCFLPTEGAGLIVFEELNRCPRYVQVPCLQLLSARRLNDYELPPGWVPCGAINDGEEYQVDDLDIAIRSRFLPVRVEPDPVQWVSRARVDTKVHSKIVEFVEQSPGVFDDSDANPRAWTYASNLLRQWESTPGNADLLAVSLAGVLGENWATAFLRYYFTESAKPLTPQQITGEYGALRPLVRQWLETARLDLVTASVELLKRHLQRQKDYDVVVSAATMRANIERFLSDLPPDLKRPVRNWLKERGFDRLKVPRKVRP
jgi:hypothetical protein